MAKAFSLRETLDACRYYFEKTGRRVTYEYALIDGVNDFEEDAYALSKIIKGDEHINLIPVNYVSERNLKRSNRVEQFKNKLQKLNRNATIRREMGADINAACGQLRNEYEALNHREGGVD